ARVGDLLDARREEADLAWAELVQHLLLGPEYADPLHLVAAARGHQLDALPLLEHPLHDAHEDDDPEVSVVPAVDEHRLQRLVPLTLRWRKLFDNGFENSLDV